MDEGLINILIANDHILYGKGVGKAISEINPNQYSLNYVLDFKATVDFLQETYVDLLIIDFQMPNGDPFETIKTIKESWPTIKIILNGMFMNSSINYFPSLLTQIDGLLSFTCSADHYVHAIDTAMSGGLYFYLP